MLGPPPTTDTQNNRAGTTNQSQVIGDLVANSHALSSPATILPQSGPNAVVNNQIPGEVPYISFGKVGENSGPSASGASQVTSNSSLDVPTPAAPPAVASTWSKFAQQTTGPSQAIESTKTLDSFQQFKKQAKEKLDKEKLIERQEQMRKEREALQEREERERLAQEQRIDQEGEIALNTLARSEQSPVLSPASDSQSPASGAGTSGGGGGGGGGSSMLSLREQERKRREALANRIDLMAPGELMSKFEDRV